MLLYVSLLERRMEVFADRGLLQKVAANEWNAALAELRAERPVDVYAVTSAISRLAPILQRDLPAPGGNGAALAEGQAAVCEYCGGKVTTGDFPWILSRIEQDEAYRG